MEDDKTIKLEILSQKYARCVSLSHSTIQTYFDILLAIIFGTMGIVVSLVEAKIIPWNKYQFLRVIVWDIIILIIVTGICMYKINKSRGERFIIEVEMELLCSNNPNQPTLKTDYNI